MKARWMGIAVATVALLGGRAAYANGSFPFVNQLVANPVDPDQLVLRGTFGLVVSKDRGANWDFLCEAGMGYKNILPPVAVQPSGAVLLALPTGISRSDSSWCSFAPGSGIEGQVVDISAVRAAPGTAIAVSVDLATRTSQVWESADDGISWQPLGAPIKDFQAKTLDAAAADPNVIFVSGVTVGANADDYLLRSEDRGQSFQQFLVPSPSPILVSSMPYIAAVDPDAVGTVYVRRDGSPGIVLVTRDGGETFEEVLRLKGLVNSFALSPDGTTLIAGNLSDGLYRADTASLEVEQIACSGVTCLSWNEGGLYACGELNLNRFLVGASSDEGASFDALLSPTCVRGPLACDATTSTGAQCPEEWPLVRSQLGATTCSPTDPPPRDDSCLTGGGSAGGTGAGGTAGAASSASGGAGTQGGGGSGGNSRGSNGEGGETSRGAGDDPASAGERSTTSPKGSEGGCGCSTATSSGGLWGVACSSALLMLRLRRRRRAAK